MTLNKLDTGRQFFKCNDPRLLADRAVMPPCQAACPLQTNVREYVDLIAQGRPKEALEEIKESNPFPSICAYVCTHPCETACRRGQVDKPIPIRALKRFAVEAGATELLERTAETKYGEKVAIIGSGPAGLSAAYYLRKLGYPVTIFEAQGELGGMLRVGIPQYRLPREVLNTEVRRLTNMGVEVRLKTRVESLDLVFQLGYKAIFLTIGAHQGLRLGVEGESTVGVVDGATFLREVNLGLNPMLGSSVGVVGGGNVAIDAARTALRLGASSVKILYRRSRDEMPADPEEVKQALEEGVEILFLAAPVKIGGSDGRLKVTLIRMELSQADASGRRQPVPVAGSETSTEFDTLITAIGQAPQIPRDFDLRIGRGSTIRIDPVTLGTNKHGVYAGGDAVTGPATVTQALAAGKQAAYRIDEYLRHKYPRQGKITDSPELGELLPRTIDKIRKVQHIEPPLLPVEDRTKGFVPIEMAYNWQEAVGEARRCLRCGMGAEILLRDKCASCLTCIRICPYDVPFVDVKGDVQIPVEQCQACGVCVGECPAKAIVLRTRRDRLHIVEQMESILVGARRTRIRPIILGFCCRYGLTGTGALASLWQGASPNVWIVPVLCVAKVEAINMLHALELGADGLFLAGCGQEQCARESTAFWALQRLEEVRSRIVQIGLKPEQLQAFHLQPGEKDIDRQLSQFVEKINSLMVSSDKSQG